MGIDSVSAPAHGDSNVLQSAQSAGRRTATAPPPRQLADDLAPSKRTRGGRTQVDQRADRGSSGRLAPHRTLPIRLSGRSATRGMNVVLCSRIPRGSIERAVRTGVVVAQTALLDDHAAVHPQPQERVTERRSALVGRRPEALVRRDQFGALRARVILLRVERVAHDDLDLHSTGRVRSLVVVELVRAWRLVSTPRVAFSCSGRVDSVRWSGLVGQHLVPNQSGRPLEGIESVFAPPRRSAAARDRDHESGEPGTPSARTCPIGRSRHRAS